MTMRFSRPLDPSLQQRATHADSRQQQQDNGTHEFQPTPQQGGSPWPDDSVHTLQAYLQRAGQLGDLPVPRAPDAQAPRRPELRLAK